MVMHHYTSKANFTIYLKYMYQHVDQKGCDPCAGASVYTECKLIFFIRYLQFCKSCLAHSRGDGLDGGKKGVEQQGEAAGGPFNTSLLVEHEPR